MGGVDVGGRGCEVEGIGGVEEGRSSQVIGDAVGVI